MAGKSGRRFLMVICGILFVLSFHDPDRVRAKEATSCLISGANVRVRAEPRVSGKELTRLSLGTVVESSEVTPDKQTIGSATAPWYKVQTPGGDLGWVFGGLIQEFKGSKWEAIDKMIQKRLENEGAPFTDRVELLGFVKKLLADLGEPEKVARFEFARLRALKNALEGLPFEGRDKPPFKDFLKEHEADIVYSEPAGSYFVRSDLFWDLSQKFKAFPVSEEIAFEGSKNPLPGESEGYLPAVLSFISWSGGKYLQLFPDGKHAGEVAKGAADHLGMVLEDLNKPNHAYYLEKEDLETFKKDLREFRAILEKGKGDEVKKAIDLVDALEKKIPDALRKEGAK